MPHSKNRTSLWCASLAAALIFWGGCASNNPGHRATRTSRDLGHRAAPSGKSGTAQQEVVDQERQQKIDETLEKLGIRQEDIVKTEKSEWPCYEHPVLSIHTEGVTCRIDSVTGTLLGYFGEFTQLDKEVTPDQIISEAQAVAIATEFAHRFGVELPEYTAQCRECGENEYLPDSLWEITGEYTYEGIPVHWTWLRIEVFAAEGKVFTFSCSPIRGYPDSVAHSLSQEEADRKAQEFLENRFLLHFALRSAKLMIVYPNNHFTRKALERETEAAKPKVCWLMHYISFDGKYVVCVYIDAETGEVAGGV